ncbi:MAG: hypothetical protein ACI96M_003895 [Candidatus Azotimanducaceae bacterium]|jgi:hypothetical protein
MDEHKCEAGYVVDTHPTAKVPSVDCIFLFDVLLHQVNPNWDTVLRRCAEKTDCFVIYNQQWIGSPITTRLLELGHDEYFASTPHDP